MQAGHFQCALGKKLIYPFHQRGTNSVTQFNRSKAQSDNFLQHFVPSLMAYGVPAGREGELHEARIQDSGAASQKPEEKRMRQWRGGVVE
jgi:hypothetical protein